MSISSLDRWLRFNLLNRNSHFKINLHDCIDEWGNTYGKNGNHIFIRIIENNGIKKGQNIIVCLSGRGDKDVHTVADYLGKKI